MYKTTATTRQVPVDAQNSAIHGAIPPKMGENLSEIRPNRHAKFHADQ